MNSTSLFTQHRTIPHNDRCCRQGSSKERDWLTTFACRTCYKAPRQSFALCGQNLNQDLALAHNVGEELVGQYLQVIRGCEFVQYDVYTHEEQGEVDVLGVSFARREVFVCEVAVHLTTGLLYVSAGKTDTGERLLKKFRKDIDYAERAFPDFRRNYMFWSPIVRSSKPGVKYDQLKVVGEVQSALSAERGVQLELVVNEKFAAALGELRTYAAGRTEELKSPLLRLMQIEAYLDRHCARAAVKQGAT